MLTDPIADMLTRIRNANLALHDTVAMPGSRLKSDIARVLEEQGYIVGHETSTDGPHSTLVVRLKYDDARRRVISGIDRVSTPGRRVYADKDSLFFPAFDFSRTDWGSTTPILKGSEA